MIGGSKLKIGSVVIDCNNFDKMLAFWQEALHYVTRAPAKDGWVILRDPEGRNTNVSLNRVASKPRRKNRPAPGYHPRIGRFHFDLYTNDQRGEVERLLKIGAIRHPQTYGPDDDFIVLKDPDGNLFCVVDTSKR